LRGPIQASLGWYGTSGQLKAVILPGIVPVFVAWLLLRVSGVPLSDRKYDKLYGNRKEYQRWRRTTPLLVPKVF
jgi:steroid 5-alpha reductase family enzyme